MLLRRTGVNFDNMASIDQYGINNHVNIEVNVEVNANGEVTNAVQMNPYGDVNHSTALCTIFYIP